MRILIVSDTHGRDGNLSHVLSKTGPLDLLIHCGDVEGSEAYIRQTAGCPARIVAGNNDFFSGLPKEEEFMLGGYKVLLTHGHYYYVSMSSKYLRQEAAARGFQIVMYGHTHKPLIDQAREENGVTLINPGSLSYPRQDGRRPSYILMELDRMGTAHYHLNYL